MNTNETFYRMGHEVFKLEDIHDNPFQGRTEYTDIESLGRSIATDDLKEFPRARMNGKGVQLQFGHRRREAFKWLKANWKKEGLTDRYEGYTVMPLFIDELSDEAMFRSAVIENEHRKELNPIEQAEMMRVYRDQFGKNSDEIGALFGMNGATVRGLVRLIDLPKDAKELLEKGRITQGTGRLLLSVMKIANEKAIKGILNILGDPENDMLPEAVIREAIGNLDNVEEMFNERWDKGKPRAGDDLWLLDMKNFPNKMLTVMEHDAAALAIGLDKVSAIENIDLGNLAISNAPEFAAFKDKYPQQAERLAHLVNPPACTACPFYMVMDKRHYCGLKECFDRKEEAFQAQKLADMSRTLKIAIYHESEGAYALLDSDHQFHKRTFEERHADLRLLPKEKFKGYAWQRFKGLDSDTGKLIAIGDLANKLSVRGSSTSAIKIGGKKTEKEKAEMRAMRLYRRVRLEMQWEYTAAAQSIFDGVPVDVLKKINRWDNIWVENGIPKEYDHPDTGSAADKLAYQRRALIWRLVMDQNSYNTRSDLTKILERFEKITGVKAPKALVKRAQEWDAEIHALAKPAVSAETKGKKK